MKVEAMFLEESWDEECVMIIHLDVKILFFINYLGLVEGDRGLDDVRDQNLEEKEWFFDSNGQEIMWSDLAEGESALFLKFYMLLKSKSITIGTPKPHVHTEKKGNI